VDSAARRAYVSHATHVVVVDIPDTPGVHGIALAPALNRGFVSNNVSIFDLKTLKTIGQVATGNDPDGIAFEPVSGKVFTFNGRSNNATAIDAKTGTVAGTTALGGKPEFPVADGKGAVFVNIDNTNEIAVIDGAKQTTILTLGAGYMGNTFGPNGLSIGSSLQVSSSK
jgi:DNA-binding beta-propeller fold protein YncE